MTSKIEWCDETWNPVTGCTPISEGCENCYAARMAKRLAGRFGYGKRHPFKPGTIHEDRFEILDKSRGWRKHRRIFVSSMGDLFHEDVPYKWQLAVLAYTLCLHGRGHTCIYLTKRPEIMRAVLERADITLERYPRLWFGVTAENQRTADERIPILLGIPAAVRFVSVEPMLGPVNIMRWLYRGVRQNLTDDETGKLDKLSWVICGGETGANARPMHIEWVRTVHHNCNRAGVPFFFKGWGEWAPSIYGSGPQPGFDEKLRSHYFDRPYPPGKTWRFGKKRAGRLLDGMEHNEFPG